MSVGEILVVVVLVAALALPIVVVVAMVNRRVDGTARPGFEVAIAMGDYLWYVDQAVDGMVEIVETLGDDLANRRPDLPGANSPYALLTHCLGVIEFWGGHVVAGRLSARDRDSEFVASGPVDDLIVRARIAQGQLRLDVRGLENAAAVIGTLDDEDLVLPLGRTQGGALVHLYEELAQHRGQMEVTRDLLVQAAG